MKKKLYLFLLPLIGLFFSSCSYTLKLSDLFGEDEEWPEDWDMSDLPDDYEIPEGSIDEDDLPSGGSGTTLKVAWEYQPKKNKETVLYYEDVNYGDTVSFDFSKCSSDTPNPLAKKSEDTNHVVYTWVNTFVDQAGNYPGIPITENTIYEALFDEYRFNYYLMFYNGSNLISDASYFGSFSNHSLDNSTWPTYNGITPICSDSCETGKFWCFNGWKDQDTNEEYDKYSLPFLNKNTSYKALFSLEDGVDVNFIVKDKNNPDKTTMITQQNKKGITNISFDEHTNDYGLLNFKSSNNKYTYKFLGWKNGSTNLTDGNSINIENGLNSTTTYIAEYEVISNKFSVEWQDKDGKTLYTNKDVVYGDFVQFDTTQYNYPEKDGYVISSNNQLVESKYELIGWEDLYTSSDFGGKDANIQVTDNLKLTPIFKENKDSYDPTVSINVDLTNAENRTIMLDLTTSDTSMLYIDYGDGSDVTQEKDHTYSNNENYTIRIFTKNSININSFNLSTSAGLLAEGNRYITKLTFDSTLLDIPDYAFNDCSNLEEIVLPNTITNLKSGVFKDCINLYSVSNYKYISSIGNYTFQNCSSYNPKALIQNGRLTYIGNYAFEQTGINEINIKNTTLEYIGEGAFINCSKLTTVYFTSSSPISKLYNYTFKNCDALNYVVLPDNLSIIGNEVFSNCSVLRSISIPEEVLNMGSQVFNTEYMNITLNIKQSTYEKYLNANIWQSDWCPETTNLSYL